MAALPSTAPVLSTPDTHIFNETSPLEHAQRERLSDEQLEIRYEIERTIAEIREQRWTRVALQFPDDMLPDSARVYQALARDLVPGKLNKTKRSQRRVDEDEDEALTEAAREMAIEQKPVKLTILADTSYGSCCVDEIAAEHV